MFGRWNVTVTRRVPALAGGCLLSWAMAGCVDTATQYSEYASRVAATGGLRTDVAPADAPFDNDDLALNFERIAFFTEYSHEDGELKKEETASTLSRWERPLKLRLKGDGVRPADRTSYQKLAKRLSNLTGIDVSVSTSDKGNVSVYILNDGERQDYRDLLLDEDDSGRFQIIDDWADEFRYPCVALVGYAGNDRGEISSAIIVIKGELEGVMRESCIHEELTQVMGLMNDHPEVRPSIFNDDEEFALLTKHDELLLRILYDARLRPAMELEEARPLIPEIVRDVSADRT